MHSDTNDTPGTAAVTTPITPKRMRLSQFPQRLTINVKTGYLSVDAEDEAFLELENGRVSVVTHRRNGGTPGEVWHSRTRWYQLATGPCVIDLDDVRNALRANGAMGKLVNAICRGHSETLDDRHSNVIGCLDAAGDRAEDLLIAHLEEEERYVSREMTMWEAGEWLTHDVDDLGVTSTTTDEEVTAIAKNLHAEARHDGCYVSTSELEDVLEHMRDECRKEAKAAADYEDEDEDEEDAADVEVAS